LQINDLQIFGIMLLNPPSLIEYRCCYHHFGLISDAQKTRLTAMTAMPDEQIDYSDAPHLPHVVWAKAGELPGAKQQ